MTSDQGHPNRKTGQRFGQDFDALYDRHHVSVYCFAFYLTRDREEADELFQETWLKIVKALRKHPAIRDFQAWIFSITANAHRDALRKKKVRRLFHGQAVPARTQSGGFTPVPPYVSGGRQPDNVQSIELGLSIREAMALLPEKQRRVFILKEIEGYTHREIGDILNLPTGTVKSLLHRAVKRLRFQLAS